MKPTIQGAILAAIIAGTAAYLFETIPPAAAGQVCIPTLDPPLPPGALHDHYAPVTDPDRDERAYA